MVPIFTFSYLTLAIRSPKSCQRFLKGRFDCILQPKPQNSTFDQIEGFEIKYDKYILMLDAFFVNIF